MLNTALANLKAIIWIFILNSFDILEDLCNLKSTLFLRLKLLPCRLMRLTHQHPRGIAAVDGDGPAQHVPGVAGKHAVGRRALVVLAAHVALHHRHPVGGERARLVGADGRGVAHGLARVQVPHQVVVVHHFLQKKKKM